MSDEAGFRIGDELFPYPETVEFGDSILIRRLTGLSMTEYADLDKDDDGDVLLLCLVGMAVRHAKRGWNLDKVVKFVEMVDFEGFKVEGPDEEPDADPPVVNGSAEPSPPPSAESTSDAAAPSSDEPPPDPTGTQA